MKARGGKELLAYETGKRLSQRQMIVAKCYDCMGKYADGKEDCGIPECPLYPLMPYGKPWRDRPRGKIPVGLRKSISQRQKQV